MKKFEDCKKLKLLQPQKWVRIIDSLTNLKGAAGNAGGKVCPARFCG